jgi:hypothetical protein
MEQILLDRTQVMGHIYVITNKENNMKYVGQSVSHRKNRNKYRPFGYIGRFNDHVSEALCNTKKKQCTYLNNAIRSYGKDAFHVELMATCPLEDIDSYEVKYIDEYNSLYPNGYNLTIGGKSWKGSHIDVDSSMPCNAPKKRGGCVSRSAETRAKMTVSLKEVMGTPEARESQMRRTQQQHTAAKIVQFKDVAFDTLRMEQYIHVRNKKDGSQFIKVIVGKRTTSFVGKYNTIDELKQKAIQFLTTIHNSSATLPNCSGNP